MCWIPYNGSGRVGHAWSAGDLKQSEVGQTHNKCTTLGMDAALWPQAVVDAIAIPATQQYPFWVKHGHRNYIPNYLDFRIPRYFDISPFTCYDCKNLTRRGHSNVYINAWKVRPFFRRVSVADPQSASIEDNHQFNLVQPSKKVPLNLGALWNPKGECLPISWIIFEESSPSHQTGKKWRPHPTKQTLIETQQGAESGLCQMVDGSTIKINLQPICL